MSKIEMCSQMGLQYEDLGDRDETFPNQAYWK